MHQRFLSWLLAGIFLSSIALRAQTPAAALPKVIGGAELILVAKVTGGVTMTVNAVVTQIAANMSVPKAAKIITTKGASVVLVFSNGATTQLGQDTEMIIEEFLQDPFAAKLEMANITEEPSVSKTKLKLNRGEIVGKVAHLKHDKGSEFVIDTPVGAAGIRGTTFRIVFTPNGTGQAFFQLSTVEGRVEVGATGTSPGSNNSGGTPAGGTPATGVTGSGTANVGVPQGQQIEVLVDVTVNAQGVTVYTVLTPATATVNIPPAIAAQVNTIAVDIVSSVQQTVFTPPPPAPPPAAGGTPAPDPAPGAGTSGTVNGSTPSTDPTKTVTTTEKSVTTVSGTKTTATTTTAPDASTTTTLANQSFTGTVTTPAPRVTTGDGKSG